MRSGEEKEPEKLGRKRKHQGLKGGGDGMTDLYQKYRDQMKTGDCLLWRSRSALGGLIRFFSRAKVNHAGLVIRLAEYGDLRDRRFTLEALEPGIVLRLLSMRIAKYKGRLWWYLLKPAYDGRRDRIGAWALLQVGTPYDYGSLFRNILGRVSADARALFCSEYCFIAWKEAEIPIKFEKAPIPGDIAKFDIFDEPVRILSAD